MNIDLLTGLCGRDEVPQSNSPFTQVYRKGRSAFSVTLPNVNDSSEHLFHAVSAVSYFMSETAHKATSTGYRNPMLGEVCIYHFMTPCVS